MDVRAGGFAGGALEDRYTGWGYGQADVVVLADVVDLGRPDGAAGFVVEGTPGFFPGAFFVEIPDET